MEHLSIQFYHFKINRKFTIPLSTIIIPMSEFLIYFQIGLKHVLDIHAYDHVLFLIALVVPFSKIGNELYF
jgi:hypothetical protein